MYTKLFSHITESTVWHEEDPIRLVWITLLAMCDREGFVHSSILGVASRARVTQDKTSEAITKFLGPDPLSMSKDYEGRRIEEVEGGWRLLNYAKYRDIKTAEERREYMRNWMREKRVKGKSVSKSVSKVDTSLAGVNNVSPSDTDTYTETESLKPDADFSVDSATSHCLIEAALAGNKIRAVVREVIQRESKVVGVDIKIIAETMAESWRKYDALQIPFKKGPEAFFGSGSWRKDQSEWKSDKKESVAERNKRAFAEVERRSK